MMDFLSECFDTAAGSAAAAMLSTSFAQYFSTKQSEICSEICCWIILPLLIRMRSRSEYGLIEKSSSDRKPWCPCRKPPAMSLWVVAACLAVVSCYKAEVGNIGLFPILTPLVLIVERKLRQYPDNSKVSDQRCSSSLSNTVWGTTLTALTLIFVLSKWTCLGSALSALPVSCLLLVYVALISRTFHHGLRLPKINIEENVIPLSCRVVLILLAALGVQTVLFGFPSGIWFLSVFSGTFKAMSWYCTIQAAKYTSWSIAPRISTFGIMSSRNPFMESSEMQCLLNIAATFLALTQVIYLCPKQARYRPLLWILALIPVIPYTANIYLIKLTDSSASWNSENSPLHAVEQLVQNAKADFETLLQRQSRKYTAAHEEYRRRYSVEPPPGFQNWYNYAVKHESLIIDEFDMIFENVSPFWKLSGVEVSGMIDRALRTPDHNLWSSVFSGKTAETRCSHPWRTNDRHISASFNDLLGDLPGVLPDIRFLVNHLDEPRVLIPPASLQGDRMSFTATNMEQRPNWDIVTKFCDSQEKNKTSEPKQKVELYDIPFITNLPSAKDLCQHPEYRTQHGLFQSPTSFHLFEGLVPILSTGAPSTMGDILFPSPAYNESAFLYDASEDIPWEKKKSNLFWAGSTTGGFATDARPEEWRNFHRQRFISVTQNLFPRDQLSQQWKRQHQYLRIDPTNSRRIERFSSTFQNLKLYTTQFTSLLHCTFLTCHSQRLHFVIRPPSPPSQAFHSTLAFDLDGNGISGRYYKLLRSKSAVLKQSVLREWHEERLLPWVHFVPVGMGMEELGELVGFLAGDGRGTEVARGVAVRGREWMGRGVRDVDRRVYVYRLMLEMARLVDSGREAWG